MWASVFFCLISLKERKDCSTNATVAISGVVSRLKSLRGTASQKLSCKNNKSFYRDSSFLFSVDLCLHVNDDKSFSCLTPIYIMWFSMNIAERNDQPSNQIIVYELGGHDDTGVELFFVNVSASIVAIVCRQSILGSLVKTV